MMLTGHVQEMIRRLAANRRERKPRTKTEKMLDLLANARDSRPTDRPETDPAVVERAIAEIREKRRREKRRQRIIAWVVLLTGAVAAACLVWYLLHTSGDGLPWAEFEIDPDTQRLRRSY